MSECHHEWAPHRIMGGWEQCANCGEQRDGEAPRDAPPAADRLAQTVTEETQAVADAYKLIIRAQAKMAGRILRASNRPDDDDELCLIREAIDIIEAIRARESAPENLSND